MSDHDLPPVMPESDWTPGQRLGMDYHRRQRVREGQHVRMQQWKIRQRHEWRWVNFEVIADWCARKPGDIVWDELRHAQAQLDLVQSVLTGEFSRKGRICVAYLPDTIIYGPFRLRLPPDGLRPQHLHLCWAPRELWVNWLDRRAYSLPPGMVAAIERTIVASTPLPKPSSQPPLVEDPPVTGAPKRAFEAVTAEKELRIRRVTEDYYSPSLADARAYLLHHFDKAPRDPVAAIRRKIWGESASKPGPKTKKAGPKKSKPSNRPTVR
jgi:hypothetical protein